MSSRSSYERIEFLLHELHDLTAQSRSEAAATAAAEELPIAATNPLAAQHVQALLALFQENLRELAQPSDKRVP